ncbi:hypothetical protein A9Q91_03240 [Candidatus Gracilibacteria bacterium 28_42_T64]|nr:hypothetical protein A9Q91_03240 [Candidatus Gracilibacteria bacterium 28_42_T64]
MTITPAMQQYYDLKEECPDAILFFRMGDFYEMFDDDAHIAHKVLGISVTTRNKNAEIPTPLAGIPYHAKQKYLPILVNAGYKVAIAEQVSDPKLKGIVKREIIRVVTPATLDLEGEEFAGTNSSNIILTIVENKEIFALSYLDIDSHIWKTGEFHDFEGLKNEIYKISPKEVILEKRLFSHDAIKNILEKKYSLNIFYHQTPSKPKEKLLKHFGVKSLEGYGIDSLILGISAAALLLDYLEMNQKSSLTFLNSIGALNYGEYMNIDESTMRNLDLLYNVSTKSGTQGTLFGVLNKTKSSGGTRILKENIIKPLQSIEEIEKRQEFIQEFYNNKILLDTVRIKLGFVSDIDSILNRLALNRANPRDLLNLKKSLLSIQEVYEEINKEGSDILKAIINN